MDDNNEIKSQKACTMEMAMNDGDISMTMRIEHDQAKQDYKKFLYATQVMQYNTTYSRLFSIKRCLTNTEA